MKIKFSTGDVEVESCTLVDFSALAYSIYYRCVFILNKRWNGEIQPPADMLIKQAKSKLNLIYEITKLPIVLVLDAGRSNKNELLGGGYKEQRKPLPINPVKIIGESLTKKHISVFCQGEEADDAIATLAYKIRQKGNICHICCSDQDIYQIKNKATKILHINKLQYITKKDLVAKYGVDKWYKIVWYKCLFGDPSDNIPTLMYRIRRKPIVQVLNKYNKWKKVVNYVIKNYQIPKEQLENRYKAIKLKKNLNVVRLVKCGNFFDCRF